MEVLSNDGLIERLLEENNRVMDNINDICALWKEVLSTVKSRVSQIAYDMWFKKLNVVKAEGDVLVLTTKLETTKKTIEKQFMDILMNSVKVHNNQINSVTIEINNDEENEKQEYLIDIISQDKKSNGFNKEYTFENFVIGESNRVAFAAAKAVAEDPGIKINPLFIYGGVGLGKTHIMHAIANYIKEKEPNKTVLYCTTHQFIDDYIDSITNTKSNDLIREFRKKYRDVDILMMDDIQFLNGKMSTQETLFHNFNDLFMEKKQIIFTSDRHPRELNQIEERMRSRFLSGLTVDIGYPDVETRIAILQKKAYQKKYCIKTEILEYIAEKIDTNIRELEAALSKVIFMCSLTKDEITIEIVNLALKDEIDNKSGPLTMNLVLEKVCEFFNVKKDDILSKKKTKNIAEARHIAVYLICELISVPLTNIGEYFGGRDHSTIIHSRNKINDLIKDNIIYKNYINDITEQIRKA